MATSIDSKLTSELVLSYNDIRLSEQHQRLFEKLVQENLFEDSYLYSGTFGRGIDKIRETGSYRRGNEIFAYTKDELLEDAEGVDSTIFDHASDSGASSIDKINLDGWIIVWHFDHLSKPEGGYSIGQDYMFNNPKRKFDAIKGIVPIKFPKI